MKSNTYSFYKNRPSIVRCVFSCELHMYIKNGKAGVKEMMNLKNEK